jgi:3-oxoadipate enol-lactonase
MQRHAFEVQMAAYEAEPTPGPVAWLDPPAADRLHELAVPTFVLLGDRDFDDFRAIGERIAAEAVDARLATIAGAKHLLAFERPVEFNQLALDFLAGVFPGRDAG